MLRLTVTIISLLFTLGCSSTPDKPGEAKKGEGKPGEKGASTPTIPGVPSVDVNTFVAGFFAALKSKTATPDQLTPAFKKVIAPPFGGEPIGFSEVKVKDFLAKWASMTVDVPKVATIGDVAFAVGKPGLGGRVLVRLVKVGAGWKVDWLSNGPATAAEVKLDDGVDAAAIQFAVAAFTDAALKKDYPLAAAQMTLPGKARIAPPFKADADVDRGYNPGQLRDAIVEAFGKAEGAAITGTTREKDDASVSLSLTNGTKKTPFTLKLVNGGQPGVWLVDAFAAK